MRAEKRRLDNLATLIYAEGRDTNITPLSRLIRRFGFMPLVGGAPGLRQPAHAEDLAIGAIAAASSPAAANKTYALPGGETLAYREMIGRIFDGLRLPRRTVSVPAVLWRAAFGLAKPLFPGANVAMGIRMMKGHDLRFHPGDPGFRLEPKEVQSRIRSGACLAFHQSVNTTVLRPLRITRSAR